MSTKQQTEYEKAFAEFTAGLTKLSLSTGIMISVCGGISYMNPKEISELEYSNDPTSGDIDYDIWEKTNAS